MKMKMKMKMFFGLFIGVSACSNAFAVTTIASKALMAGQTDDNVCTGNCSNTDQVTIVGHQNILKDINTPAWPAWGQVIGAQNNISGSTHMNVVGDGNLIVNTSSVDVLGTHNNVQASSNTLVSGSYNKVTADDAVVLGNGNTVTAKNSVTLGDKSTNDRQNTVSIGAAGSERQIINVAKATLGTDAVNLDQMSSDINVAKNDAVAQSNTNTTNQITQNNIKINSDIVTAKNDAVAQSNTNTTNQITQNNIKINSDIVDAKTAAVNTANTYSDAKYQMSVDYTDVRHAQNITYATNVAQQAEENANLYTDYMFNQFKQQSNERFEQLSNKIDKAEKRLNAGIAGVTAISSIPYIAGNTFSYGIGLGNYQNGNAIALGGQYKVSSNGNARLNISWDSSQNVTLGLGLAGGW